MPLIRAPRPPSRAASKGPREDLPHDPSEVRTKKRRKSQNTVRVMPAPNPRTGKAAVRAREFNEPRSHGSWEDDHHKASLLPEESNQPSGHPGNLSPHRSRRTQPEDSHRSNRADSARSNAKERSSRDTATKDKSRMRSRQASHSGRNSFRNNVAASISRPNELDSKQLQSPAALEALHSVSGISSRRFRRGNKDADSQEPQEHTDRTVTTSSAPQEPGMNAASTPLKGDGIERRSTRRRVEGRALERSASKRRRAPEQSSQELHSPSRADRERRGGETGAASRRRRVSNAEKRNRLEDRLSSRFEADPKSRIMTRFDLPPSHKLLDIIALSGPGEMPLLYAMLIECRPFQSIHTDPLMKWLHMLFGENRHAHVGPDSKLRVPANVYDRLCAENEEDTTEAIKRMFHRVADASLAATFMDDTMRPNMINDVASKESGAKDENPIASLLDLKVPWFGPVSRIVDIFGSATYDELCDIKYLLCDECCDVPKPFISAVRVYVEETQICRKSEDPESQKNFKTRLSVLRRVLIEHPETCHKLVVKIISHVIDRTPSTRTTERPMFTTLVRSVYWLPVESNLKKYRASQRYHRQRMSGDAVALGEQDECSTESMCLLVNHVKVKVGSPFWTVDYDERDIAV